MTIDINNMKAEISAVKAPIRFSGVDLKSAFEAMDARVESQISEIEFLMGNGLSPVPEIYFAELDNVVEERMRLIKRRGCVIIRRVFAEERVENGTRC